MHTDNHQAKPSLSSRTAGFRTGHLLSPPAFEPKRTLPEQMFWAKFFAEGAKETDKNERSWDDN